MDWKATYERWLSYSELDTELKEQLKLISGNEQLLEECFYKNLEFGTGGMRGELGPGTNRLNIYTLRKAAEGLAKYIQIHGQQAMARGVVIAYDNRHKSEEFALQAAITLGAYGIKSYVFNQLRPTPMLSFAVRYLQAFSGIVITASHNPPEYNGFKVYGEDGAQLTPEAGKLLVEKVNEIENELLIKVAEKNSLLANGLLEILDEEVDIAYTEQLKTVIVNEEIVKAYGDKVKIVFTPLHGTATLPVQLGFEAAGFTNYTIVEEQAIPDANFSTVTSPNPEEHEAFKLAISYGEEIDADVLIATDPDADRVGIAVKDHDGQYIVLTGNQTGALMLNYLLSQKQLVGSLPKNGAVIKTIVTSELGRVIAAAHQLQTIDTLTGFKFIGERIKEFEKTGEHTFVFGYEESYGYLIKDFARDKDAVQAVLLAAELAAFYKATSKTLYDALMELYKKYGYYLEDLHSLTLKGRKGIETMNQLISELRDNPPEDFAGTTVDIVEDYLMQTRVNRVTGAVEQLNLPKSNVLKYKLTDESWVCIRPSGTEPKIKFYFGVTSKTLTDSCGRLEKLKTALLKRIGVS